MTKWPLWHWPQKGGLGPRDTEMLWGRANEADERVWLDRVFDWDYLGDDGIINEYRKRNSLVEGKGMEWGGSIVFVSTF